MPQVRAMASMQRKPMLCLVPAYLSPGLPRPTIIRICRLSQYLPDKSHQLRAQRIAQRRQIAGLNYFEQIFQPLIPFSSHNSLHQQVAQPPGLRVKVKVYCSNSALQIFQGQYLIQSKPAAGAAGVISQLLFQLRLLPGTLSQVRGPVA